MLSTYVVDGDGKLILNDAGWADPAQRSVETAMDALAQVIED